jgi:threonine synthase
MVAVSDSELMDAVGLLASTAGVGAEPAGAASLAGLRSALREGLVDRNENVVVLVTGREIKAAGSPSRGRVAVAHRLDDVREAFERVPL